MCCQVAYDHLLLTSKSMHVARSETANSFALCIAMLVSELCCYKFVRWGDIKIQLAISNRIQPNLVISNSQRNTCQFDVGDKLI